MRDECAVQARFVRQPFLRPALLTPQAYHVLRKDGACGFRLFIGLDHWAWHALECLGEMLLSQPRLSHNDLAREACAGWGDMTSGHDASRENMDRRHNNEEGKAVAGDGGNISGRRMQ